MAKARDYSGMLKILKGEQRGPFAMLIRSGLWLLTPLYRVVVGWRNWRFNRGKGVHRVGVPVISVGNLTTGGTGKTPFVIWLASYLRGIKVESPHGLRLAILSRGYGSLDGQGNDEALEIEQRLPDVPHLQGPDRVQLATTAIEELETEAILLDDGFQHRRIFRDLDIVLVDATQPFGLGHLLPRGLLREPVSSLTRADIVVLTRCHQISEQSRRQIKQQVLESSPSVLWVECDMQPTRFLQASGTVRPLEELHGQAVMAISAIGNPAGFQATLTGLGMDIRHSIVWGDHHHYLRADLETIRSTASQHSIKAVVCTQKDLVKLNVDQIGNLPLLALQVDAKLGAGQAALEERIQELLVGSTPERPFRPGADSDP